jgi:hypothetical protein
MRYLQDGGGADPADRPSAELCTILGGQLFPHLDHTAGSVQDEAALFVTPQVFSSITALHLHEHKHASFHVILCDCN